MNGNLPLFLLAAILASACTSATTNSANDGETDVTSASNTSAYTSLESCHPDESPDQEIPTMDCGGMGGFTLHVEDFDSRQNVQVMTPDGVKHDLLVPAKTTGGFSHLGKQAEWRGKFVSPGVVDPQAVIFRYIEANPETGLDDRESLIVVRLEKAVACIESIVDASQSDANEKARTVVDQGATARCSDAR